MARIQFSLRKLIVITLLAGVAVGYGVKVWSGSRIVETLDNPQKVVGWNELGLILDGGRIAPVPGRTKLPLSSVALSAAIQNGIEESKGRVTGLIRVHHWCGNDPVRLHLARVDLARLLQFYNEGEPINSNPECIFDGLRFRPAGWNVSAFGTFQQWCLRRDSEDLDATAR